MNKQAKFYGREGVVAVESDGSIRTAHWLPEKAETLEEAQRSLRGSAFWTGSTLYIAERTDDGKLRIVSVLRDRDGEWEDEIYDFEIIGKL